MKVKEKEGGQFQETTLTRLKASIF
jgi:hypothetical protein